MYSLHMLLGEHLDENENQILRITHADLNTNNSLARLSQPDAQEFANAQAASIRHPTGEFMFRCYFRNEPC